MGNRFPLLLIPIGIYNLIALVSGIGTLFSGGEILDLTSSWLVVPMTSPGSQWHISPSDLLVFVGLICLFFEVLKSTNTSNSILLNHAFSMFVFIVGLVEFLLLKPFATSAFFLLVVMTALDVLGGFIITTIGARKDIGL